MSVSNMTKNRRHNGWECDYKITLMAANECKIINCSDNIIKFERMEAPHVIMKLDMFTRLQKRLLCLQSISGTW